MFNICDFLISIMAGFVSGLAVHYFCKWLDSNKTKNKSN
ncbi:MAG: type I toxin-antitoxin system Fst family toxin [Clostridioides difficile]|nr:type I toxin-antitoxin system Fst family toxin [Fusobacterium sp.]